MPDLLLLQVQSWYGCALAISQTWTDKKFKLTTASFLPWLLTLLYNVNFRIASMRAAFLISLNAA